MTGLEKLDHTLQKKHFTNERFVACTIMQQDTITTKLLIQMNLIMTIAY